MRSLFLIFCLVFCVLVVHANGEKAPAEAAAEGSGDAEEAADSAEDKDVNEEAEEKEEESEESPSKEDADEDADDDADDAEDADAAAETPKEFVCNLKYKRMGCYADKGAKDKPLASFLMSDQDMGTTTKKGKLPKSDTFNGELPKFACKCANEALTTGNAIFGLQNIAECWSGPDDSKYDKDGPSDNCITFDYATCAAESEVCAGKKGANFMYYIDTPDHTKTQDEIDKELAEDKKLQEKEEKKKEKAAKKAKKGKKKAKKSKAKH